MDEHVAPIDEAAHGRLHDPRTLVAFGIAHAPPGLVSDEAKGRLATIPDALPATFEVGAFECHLGHGTGRVDFEACVRAVGGGRAALAPALASPAIERLASQEDGWRRTIAFLRAWSDPTSALHHGVDAAWLEFDLDHGAVPSPFVVFTLCRDEDERAPYSARYATALRDALDLLASGVPAGVASTVEAAVAALAPTGALLHAGVRPLEHGAVVRLVARLPRPHIPAYLDRIGWPGSATELARVLHELCPSTVLHSLNLDVAERVGPRVGVEYHFRTSPLDDPRWQSVFDGLVATGACTPERREQVSAWRPRGHAMRAPMREVLVKVVHEPGRPLAAKAYLPFTTGAWTG